MTDGPTTPAWFRELHSALGISPHIVLEGNVDDRYQLPTPDGAGERIHGSLVDAVWACLAASGFEAAVVGDPAAGVRAHPATTGGPVASEVLGRPVSSDWQARSLEGLRDDLLATVRSPQRAAMVLQLAGRFAPTPAQLTREEQALFVAAEHAALTARSFTADTGGQRSVPIYNAVIWIVERDRDLPEWLVAHDDHVRTITIPRPDFGQRTRCAARLLPTLAGWPAATTATQHQAVDRVVRLTDGMTLNALFAITLLATEAGTTLERIEDAVRAYRIGVVDNPWRTGDLRRRLEVAETDLQDRVLGQPDAVRKTLDIVLRAATGLSGAHGSPHGTRPRGTLFFAGPTGVGKTELAKQLARTVFGDERACIRFDMSEFSAEHAADRLIGAPPGYVGFAAGGELTNALRERPFSVILFDEIEKAHPKILDKFLQVLDDGRLTDGRGATVYFTEAILVFTSNLGIRVRDAEGRPRANVTRETPRDEAEATVRAAIADHFTEELGRPELLNRFGDGIVVFDFIRDDTAADILQLLVANVARRVRLEYEVDLVLDPAAVGQLQELALANLDNGGRGIGTVVESALVNPLARHVFATPPPGPELRILAIRAHGLGYELEVA